ncbi:hypothetical protein ACTXNC_09830, partial [Psychrobacter celer]|uniref:hypothetical protein n=1 Tax=Psychrobacter celer TaxID=306572 RepID=UPI003FD22FCF
LLFIIITSDFHKIIIVFSHLYQNISEYILVYQNISFSSQLNPTLNVDAAHFGRGMTTILT